MRRSGSGVPIKSIPVNRLVPGHSNAHLRLSNPVLASIPRTIRQCTMQSSICTLHAARRNMCNVSWAAWSGEQNNSICEIRKKACLRWRGCHSHCHWLSWTWYKLSNLDLIPLPWPFLVQEAPCILHSSGHDYSILDMLWHTFQHMLYLSI